MAQFFEEWEEKAFFLRGQPLKLRVKVPLFDDAPEFARKMTAFGRAALRAMKSQGEQDEIPTEETSENLLSAMDPKWVRDTFTKCVEPVEPIVIQSRGPNAKPIQTGAEVYEIANTALVLQVLHTIQSMTMLGETEGKASSSPSTSGAGTVPDAGPATDSGGSLATTTGPADGPTA